MNFDIDTLKQVLGTFGTVITILRQAKDLLPEDDKKQEISTAIDDAERQLKIAEAQTAQSMGYKICKAHFPPGIMVSLDSLNWRCQDCGNEIYIPKPTDKHPLSGVKGL